MYTRLIPLTLCATILALIGGCDKGKDVAKEEIDRGPGALTCKPNTMQGTVSLTITGIPGDSFRISYLCGGTQVTQCTATIPAGATTASCNAGPTAVPNTGVRSCPVGPGNANSPQAAVQTSGCG